LAIALLWFTVTKYFRLAFAARLGGPIGSFSSYWLGIHAAREVETDLKSPRGTVLPPAGERYRKQSADLEAKEADGHAAEKNGATHFWRGVWSFCGFTTDSIHSICLNDVSLIATHLHQRYLSFEGLLLKSALFPAAWTHSPVCRRLLWDEVMSFVVVLCVDLVLGLMLGLCMRANHDIITDSSIAVFRWLQRSLLIDSMTWFNDSPGGVKLNFLITSKAGSGDLHFVYVMNESTW
jgi:hypothetical protein